MPKLRSDALWNTLTPEQRTQLEDWLLEQNLSYRETHIRAQKELGLTCSLSTVSRFYKYLIRQRANEELLEAEDAVTDLAETGPSADKLRAVALKLITTRLLDKTMQHADVKEICALGRLVLQSQQRDIQQARNDLARERFEFKAAKAALKALPLVDEMTQEDEAREVARVEKLKLKIFGKELLDKVAARQAALKAAAAATNPTPPVPAAAVGVPVPPAPTIPVSPSAA